MRFLRRTTALACLIGGLPTLGFAAVIDEATFLSNIEAASPRTGSVGDSNVPVPGAGGAVELLPNPVAGYERETDAAGLALTTWSLGWTLPWSGQKSARIRAARSEVAAIGQEHRADVLAQRGELRAVYAGWALGAERARVARELRDRFADLATRTSARARAGEESGLAERRLRLARVEVEAAVARIDAAALAAQAAARVWSPGTHEDDVPELPLLPTLPPSLATDPRPDVAALEFRVAQAEFEADAAGTIFAAPEIEIGWRRLSDGGESRADGTRARVQWPLPLFQRNAPDRAVAQQELRTSRSRLFRARRMLQEKLIAHARDAGLAGRANPEDERGNAT